MPDIRFDLGADRGRQLPALILIGLGVLGLMAASGVLRVLGGIIGGLLLGGLAYFVYHEGRRRASTAWRLAAYPIGGLAIAAVSPFGLGGAAFLAGLGLAFTLAWRENERRWWALIPGGALASLAAVAFFESTVRVSFGWLFLLGLAATFFVLTRLRAYAQRWAIYPAAGFAVMAFLSLSGVGSWLIPAVMIGAGAWLLFGSGRSLVWASPPNDAAGGRAKGGISGGNGPGDTVVVTVEAAPGEVAEALRAAADAVAATGSATGSGDAPADDGAEPKTGAPEA